eukprot:5219380-Amphidinium_carterae.1
MQERVPIKTWLPMLQKGLLMMSADPEDRSKCKLACPYPMLVNLFICQNSAFKALVPPFHTISKFSFDCFEVVTALKIAAEY